MKEQVAVKRHTSRRASRVDGRHAGTSRPSGRRWLLLAVLAGAGMVAFGAGAAQSLAAGLPDGRAYELVSPAVKAAEVEHLVIISGDQAAPNGNSLAYVALSPVDGSNGPGIDDLATRGPNGWTTKDTLPPQAPGRHPVTPRLRALLERPLEGPPQRGRRDRRAGLGPGLPIPGSGHVHDAVVPHAAGDDVDALHRRADRPAEHVRRQSEQ